jgi:hypothetical protein
MRFATDRLIVWLFGASLVPSTLAQRSPALRARVRPGSVAEMGGGSILPWPYTTPPTVCRDGVRRRQNAPPHFHHRTGQSWAG